MGSLSVLNFGKILSFTVLVTLYAFNVYTKMLLFGFPSIFWGKNYKKTDFFSIIFSGYGVGYGKFMKT